MVLYIGMMFWFVLANVFVGNRKLSFRKSGDKKIEIYFYPIVTMGVYVFFAGARGAIADSAAYIAMFRSMPSEFSAIFDYIKGGGKEVGFYALGLIINILTNGNYHVYFMVIAAISGYAIAHGIEKYSPYMCTSMLLFMLLGFFGWMLNGIRQFLAVSILFCNLDLIVKKDYKKYFLLILALFTIHHSVIIMAPMIFIVTGKPWNKRTVLVLLASVLAIMAASSFTGLLAGALENTSYAGATDQFLKDDGVNPIRVLIEAVPCLIALVYRKRIEQENSALLNVLVNFSVIAVGIALIGVVTSGILVGRLICYFSIYNLILLPWLVNNLFGNASVLVKMAMYILYGIYFMIDSGEFYYVSELLGLYFA